MASPKTNTLVRVSMRDAFERGRTDPVKWAWDWLGLDLHEGQETFVRNATAPGIKEGNVSAGNRWGKSEVDAVLLGHSSFYMTRNPDFAEDSQGNLRPYVACNISISLAQASIVFDKLVGYLQASKKMAPFVDRVVNSPFPELRFKPVKGARQGAEVWARSTANNARFLLGHKFDHIGWDEVALEPDGENLLNSVLRMRMADSGGSLYTYTQPRGKNWAYYHFLKGLKDSGVYDPSCYSQYGVSFENPHIDAAYIRRAMKFMTAESIQENVYGRHSDFDSFFPADQVARLYKDQDYKLPIPAGHHLVWKTHQNIPYAQILVDPAARNHVYVMGVDLADKKDETCIVVLRVDCSPWQMVHFELINKVGWQAIKERVAQVHKQYGAWGLADSTGAGGPIVEDLQGDLFNCDIEGYNFGGSTEKKATLLYELQLATQNREFVFPYFGENDQRGTRPLVSQLTHYKLDDKKLRTDAVFGVALAVKAARDWFERSRIPPVETPDIPGVIVTYDAATGLPIIRRTDELDDDFDMDDPRQLARAFRHLTALL